MSEPTQLTVADETLKVMIAQYGVRGTARVLGMDQRQTDAFRRRVSRAKWLHDPALAVAMKKNGAGLSPVAIAKPIVATVSPQQAIAQEISGLGTRSRLGLARGVSKVADYVAERSGAENLTDAQKIKASAQTADMVFGWKDTAPQFKIRLDVLNGSAEATPIDIEADTTGEESWSETDPLDEY